MGRTVVLGLSHNILVCNNQPYRHTLPLHPPTHKDKKEMHTFEPHKRRSQTSGEEEKKKKGD